MIKRKLGRGPDVKTAVVGRVFRTQEMLSLFYN